MTTFIADFVLCLATTAALALFARPIGRPSPAVGGRAVAGDRVPGQRCFDGSAALAVGPGGSRPVACRRFGRRLVDSRPRTEPAGSAGDRRAGGGRRRRVARPDDLAGGPHRVRAGTVRSTQSADQRRRRSDRHRRHRCRRRVHPGRGQGLRGDQPGTVRGPRVGGAADADRARDVAPAASASPLRAGHRDRDRRQPRARASGRPHATGGRALGRRGCGRRHRGPHGGRGRAGQYGLDPLRAATRGSDAASR